VVALNKEKKPRQEKKGGKKLDGTKEKKKSSNHCGLKEKIKRRKNLSFAKWGVG